MLKEFIQAARRNEPVYLPRVREAFLKEGGRPFLYRAISLEGEARTFSLPLPEAEEGEEEAFLTSYVYANLYNLICAMGARRVEVYTDLKDPFLRRLALGLEEGFQTSLPLKERSGYGSCLKVNQRILTTLGLGESFCFQVYPLEEFARVELSAESTNTVLEPSRQVEAKFLEDIWGQEKRQNPFLLEEKLPGKRLLGMDIGGTDIKLAVSLGSTLCLALEYDWNPAAYESAGEFLAPLALLSRICQVGLSLWEAGDDWALFLSLEGDASSLWNILEEGQGRLEKRGRSLKGFDGIGVSFPDVVIDDVIVGGETDKTAGIRKNAQDYEGEFARISRLKDFFSPLLERGGEVHICNDGTMAAFTAALEGAAAGEEAGGYLCHSLGTDLGTGWVYGDGRIAPYPLECYQFLIDLGSWGDASFPPEDIRSSRGRGSTLPGCIQRYANQSGVFRWAAGALLKESLERGFFTWEGQVLSVPPMRRKAFLNELLTRKEAREAFLQVGESLGEAYRELSYLTGNHPEQVCLFGRLVKGSQASEWIREGMGRSSPGVTLRIADESLARGGLMRQLLGHPGWSVPQYGQAVGAIYFALPGRGTQGR